MAETTHSSAIHPGLERSPRKNWIDRLPAGLTRRWHKSWIYRAAKHIHYDKGRPIGSAIKFAVNAAKKGCATGDLNWPGFQQVSPKSRAEMCEAVATWTAMKAYSGGKSTVNMANDLGEAMTIDLAYISAEERKKALGKGQAVKKEDAPGGGGWPIRGPQDLQDAIRLFKMHHNKYPPEKQKRLAAHIRRHAKRLGKEVNLSNDVVDLATLGHAFNPAAHQRIGGRFVSKGAKQANVGAPTSVAFASAMRDLKIGQSIDLPSGKGVVKRLADGWQVRTGDGKYNKIFKNVTDAVSVAGKIIRSRIGVTK